MTRPGRCPGVRRSAAGILLLAVALLAAACSGTSPSKADAATTGTVPWVVGTGGTLTIGIDQAPTGCNPDTATGDTWADRFVLAPVLPSAFEVNAKDQPVYDSAVISQAELQSTSPQTVVYTINPKAVWSDGVPITAADFVYTWHQQRGTGGPIGVAPASPGTSATGGATGPAGGTTTAGTATTAPVGPTSLPSATGTTGTLMGYRQIQSIKGSDHGRTVTVVFRTPYSDWQALFDDLLPAHVLQKRGWNPTCSSVSPSIDLSAGPYEITGVVPGKQVVLSRNPRWWQEPGDAQRIVIKTASSSAQLASWLASGRVQVAAPTTFGQAFFEQIGAAPSAESASSQSTTFLQLELSTTAAPTASLPVREAVAHAVDRQQLVNQVVGWADTSIVPAASHLYSEVQASYPVPKQPPPQIAGQGAPTTTTVPATPTPAAPFPTTADLPTAAKLLSQAGNVRQADGTWRGPDGVPLTLRMAVDAGDSWAASAAPLLLHQLAAAGIPTTAVPEPTATATGMALASGSVELALLPMHSTPYPTTALAWYTTLLGSPGQGGSQDWTNFNDPTLDQLLVKASQQLNPVDAAPVYTQADMLLWQDMVALPLFTEPTAIAWSSSIGGVVPDPNGPNGLFSVEDWGHKVPPNSPRVAKTQPSDTVAGS